MCVYVCVGPCCQPYSGGLVIHIQRTVLCGVANGSSLVPDRVVEISQGQGAIELLALQPSNRASQYIHFMHSIHHLHQDGTS